MKKIYILFTLCLLLIGQAMAQVKVVAHRGDWRNAPENSLQAVTNCIEMGVDMVEIDIARTKDGELVLMHDRTIDRTTTGKGSPSDYALEELRNFRLRNGTGRKTDHLIPTLREVLEVTGDKVLLNIDKGYDYFPQVYRLLQETGTLAQVVIKSSYPYEKVKRENGEVLEKVMYMPVVNLCDAGARLFIDGYLDATPIYGIECVFNVVTPQVLTLLEYLREKEVTIWINTLWPELCGGHDDDRAVEMGEMEESWGWVLSQGATLIQTDRPVELIRFLRSKGLHP